MITVRKAWLDLVALVALLVAGWKLTFRLEFVTDIGLADETFYLNFGRILAQSGIYPSPEWSPLYARWYAFLTSFEAQPVLLYYLNFKVLTILLPLIVYLCLRRYRVSILPALAISGYFLISPMNLPAWPKPANFALILILIWLFVDKFIDTTWRSLLWLIIGGLFFAYARPELFLAYILLSICWLGYVLWRRPLHDWMVHSLAVMFIVLISAILLNWWGQPAFGGDGDRSFFAFAQHFSINWSAWSGDTTYAPMTDWVLIAQENFGPVDSFTEAFRANPTAVIRHFIANLSNTLETIRTLLLPPNHFVLPMAFPAPHFAESTIVLLLLVVLLVVLNRPNREAIRAQLTQNRRLLFYCGLLSIPSLISAFVIFPRNHYLIIPLTLFLICTAIVLTKPDATSNVSWRVILPSCILLIALTPSVSDQRVPIAGLQTVKDNVTTVYFLGEMRFTEPVFMLETQGGFDIYLPPYFNRINAYEKGRPFDEFIEVRGINLILLSDALRNDIRFRSDSTWDSFLDDIGAYGFIEMPVPDTSYSVLVKEAILR